MCMVFTLNASNPYSINWGATGHRTVGKIAEGYLTSKAKRNIAELLDGKSLALVSTYGDDIKSDKNYREFYTWHYINMPFDVRYEDSEKNESGDLITGIETCKSVILNKNSSKEEKAFYLKMLVHLIGDLHQPLHVGRAEDKGANDIQVQWFGDGTNLHSVWDSKLIEHYNMTFTELAQNTDKISKEQVKYLQKGTVIDWANETQQLAIKVYGTASVGDKIGYGYMYENFELVRSQLQIAGVRLAYVLNTMFK